MGLYDTLLFDEDPVLPDFDEEEDPAEISWQTKTFQPCEMTTYRITPDGMLLEEEAEYNILPEEERPMYNKDIGGFEEEWHKACGMLSKEHQGWTQNEYHGMLEFHGSVNDHLYRFEAKFTDGELVDITRIDSE